MNTCSHRRRMRVSHLELRGKTRSCPQTSLTEHGGSRGLRKEQRCPTAFLPQRCGGMSIFGYDPTLFTQERAPIEASAWASHGPNEVAYRATLSIRQGGRAIPGYYAGGHISTEKHGFLSPPQQKLAPNSNLLPRVGYRHIMIWKAAPQSCQRPLPHAHGNRPPGTSPR
jgi:hypothetical protein